MFKGDFMKKTILIASVLALLTTGCSDKTKSATSKFIKVIPSSSDINGSKDAIVKNLSSKNYKLITSYNHEKDALALKQMLYPTLTIEINNPKISTKLISCNPSIAQDLPIRVALYNKINGETYISYTDPEYWSLKHNIKDATCINLVIAIKQDLQEAVDSITKKSK
jgi:uncharacterized protein (DUF302 family)